MPTPAKIRILLADEDALRRDGLAAVLSGQPEMEVVGSSADGEAALAQIRSLHPDIAVVDLNLPKVHGIELVRRIRAESLGTRVIVVASTPDDEIVREVVRAGGDGYLLKNGPARHLIDAISYIRDGGQYFSPQLQRDGRDRHLLVEPARTPAQPQAAEPAASEADTRAAKEERARRRGARPKNDSASLRQRIREAAPQSNMDDRDYEIMSRMADGIRPILDRLDEIDSRVASMEDGASPVPADPRGWLSTQLADSFRDPRAGTDVAVIGRSVNDLEARLPRLIEDAVTQRFHQMAGKLQQEIEETHVRTLETFVKNIQVKLVQRVSALEHDMSKQAEAMGQLQESSQRTEDNLSRLISGVDKLARELPRRLAAGGEPKPAQPVVNSEPEAFAASPATEPKADDETSRQDRVRRKRRISSEGNRGVKIFWAVAGAVVLLVVLAWTASTLVNKKQEQASSITPAAEKPKIPSAMADTKTKMQAAQEGMDRKDYAVAEDLYKQIVKAEPTNVDALKGLASVLYREDKIEESAAILDKIAKN
jgi:DNA-binding NarL/FixJ family response regulator/cell division protein FtsB